MTNSEEEVSVGDSLFLTEVESNTDEDDEEGAEEESSMLVTPDLVDDTE